MKTRTRHAISTGTSTSTSTSASTWTSFLARCSPSALFHTTGTEISEWILSLCDVRIFGWCVAGIHAVLMCINIYAQYYAETYYRPDECSTLRPFVRWHAVGSAAIVVYSVAVSTSCSWPRGHKKGKSVSEPFSAQFSEPLRTMDLALGLGAILLFFLLIYSCVTAVFLARLCTTCPALYRASALCVMVDQIMFVIIFTTTIIASCRQ